MKLAHSKSIHSKSHSFHPAFSLMSSISTKEPDPINSEISSGVLVPEWSIFVPCYLRKPRPLVNGSAAVFTV